MGGCILACIFSPSQKRGAPADLLLEKGARRAGFPARRAGRPPKRPSAKPKDVGEGLRGLQGALDPVLEALPTFRLPWIFPQFYIIPHFWARKGSPLYLAEKVTNP